jgi:hypothetical protein
MCRYIVGKIIWEEMQKHTDIQTPEMDEKIEKHRIVQRDAGKEKNALKFRAFFFTNSKLYIVENHKLNVYQLVQHLSYSSIIVHFSKIRIVLVTQ